MNATTFITITSVNASQGNPQLNLPYEVKYFNPLHEGNISNVIVSHGLGAKNPKVKNHTNDEWIPIINKGSVSSSSIKSIVSYTARGHGDSNG